MLQLTERPVFGIHFLILRMCDRNLQNMPPASSDPSPNEWDLSEHKHLSFEESSKAVNLTGAKRPPGLPGRPKRSGALRAHGVPLHPAATRTNAHGHTTPNQARVAAAGCSSSCSSGRSKPCILSTRNHRTLFLNVIRPERSCRLPICNQKAWIGPVVLREQLI